MMQQDSHFLSFGWMFFFYRVCIPDIFCINFSITYWIKPSPSKEERKIENKWKCDNLWSWNDNAGGPFSQHLNQWKKILWKMILFPWLYSPWLSQHKCVAIPFPNMKCTRNMHSVGRKKSLVCFFCSYVLYNMYGSMMLKRIFFYAVRWHRCWNQVSSTQLSQYLSIVITTHCNQHFGCHLCGYTLPHHFNCTPNIKANDQ